MTKDEIIEFAKNQIIQSLAKYSNENNKVEFKRQWYDFNKENEKFEFIKDLTSLVNTIGSDGFLIIGFDNKSHNFIDSHLSVTNKTDLDLLGIIKNTVDRPFNFEAHDFEHNQHKLCVVHTLPSLNKPHVIRNYIKGSNQYPNEIFIRKGSSNERASKSDLDLMYAEKNTIIIERDVRISYIKSSIRSTGFLSNNQFTSPLTATLNLTFDLIIHNRGIEDIHILKIEIYATMKADTNSFPITLIYRNGNTHSIKGKSIHRESSHYKYSFYSAVDSNWPRNYNALYNQQNFHYNLLEISHFILHLSDGTTITNSLIEINSI